MVSYGVTCFLMHYDTNVLPEKMPTVKFTLFILQIFSFFSEISVAQCKQLRIMGLISVQSWPQCVCVCFIFPLHQYFFGHLSDYYNYRQAVYFLSPFKWVVKGGEFFYLFIQTN